MAVEKLTGGGGKFVLLSSAWTRSADQRTMTVAEEEACQLRCSQEKARKRTVDVELPAGSGFFQEEPIDFIHLKGGKASTPLDEEVAAEQLPLSLPTRFAVSA